MPGFSGLSNQSCERRVLPLGCGVCGSLPLFLLFLFLPFVAISSSPEARTPELVWFEFAGLKFRSATAFEFAFENYTALGYGDPVPPENRRLIGPITALNGLLLIGWSVAIIFEVMRMAEVQVARLDERDEN